MEEGLDGLITSVRIRASRDVIIKPEGRSIAEIMHESSRDADVALVGLTIPKAGRESEYSQRLIDIVTGLPTTILVRNSGPFRGRLL